MGALSSCRAACPPCHLTYAVDRLLPVLLKPRIRRLRASAAAEQQQRVSAAAPLPNASRQATCLLGPGREHCQRGRGAVGGRHEGVAVARIGCSARSQHSRLMLTRRWVLDDQQSGVLLARRAACLHAQKRSPTSKVLKSHVPLFHAAACGQPVTSDRVNGERELKPGTMQALQRQATAASVPGCCRRSGRGRLSVVAAAATVSRDCRRLWASCWPPGLVADSLTPPAAAPVSQAPAAEQARVAVLGASGYTGAEVVRLSALHPHLKITALTGDRQAGKVRDTARGAACAQQTTASSHCCMHLPAVHHPQLQQR